MKSFIKLTLFTLSLTTAGFSTAQAELYEVKITNLTRGQIFSPVFALTHNRNLQLFSAGEAASDELAALAKDADTTGLESVFSGAQGVHEIVNGNGAIMPGKTDTIMIHSKRRMRFLSLASMLVTTNDAFLALNKIKLPKWYQATYNVPAYDAGAEDNDESCDYIPGPPCDNPGKASAIPGEGFVHIHAGIHGIGSLNPAQHDWRNPVARISVKRVNKYY